MNDFLPVRGVLFDLDGTLIDSYDAILCSMRATLERAFPDRTFTDAELMAGVGTPLLDQMVSFARGDAERGAELTRAYREHNDDVHDEKVHAFPGTREALESLREQGIRMGIVTSKRSMSAERGLREAGIADLLEFVIAPDTWPEHKPNPGPVLHGCDLLELPPAACLYVGDSRFDIQAGTAAGCRTVAALWGMFPHEVTQEQPTYALQDITELPSLVAGCREAEPLCW